MAITTQQDIPNRPEVKEPWTFKRLLSPSSVGTITKVFTNPLEVLLGYIIFIVGVAVLIGQKVPTLFYFLSFLILAAVVYERFTRPPEIQVKVGKKNAK